MTKNKKTTKKVVQKRVKRIRPRGIKSLRLEREYLKNRFKERK